MLGKSCEDNIVDLLQIINTAKDLEQAYRDANVRNHQREKTYLLFIDLKKAFEKVPRRGLIQKMTDMNIIVQLVETIHEILRGTKAEVNDEKINMDIGVP